MRSTSIHNLNADRGLNILQKPLYLFLNWINNLLPYENLDNRIEIRPADLNNFESYWTKTYPQSSAGRKLSDLFWYALPWDKIRSELGQINVFDTGCGSGNYGLRIDEASEGIDSYTGIDAKEKSNWETLQKDHSNFHLIKSVSTNILPLIPLETNLFITQSAIEHFDEDISFFEQIKEFIQKSDGPVLQVHIFPAAAALPLYLFHGLRQYTPRNVSKITRLFGKGTRFYLFGLGGKASKKVHWKFFSWPILYLRRKGKWEENISAYDTVLHEAVRADNAQIDSSPLFWALVIHSNHKKTIW